MLNGSKRTKRAVVWPCLFISVIVIAFAVITVCGFVYYDDYAMSQGIYCFKDILTTTWNWYFTYGGGVFAAATQFLFCGLLKNNRLWFDIVNTLFFILLLVAASGLIGKKKIASANQVLLFALLFWFLCPVPRETVFWAVGSTAYLWTTVLVLSFLVVYEQCKASDYGIAGKIALLLFSMMMAANIIPSVSICGAFVVYYIFHIKEFKGNAVPLVVGFAIGSILLVFAPGNFARAAIQSEYGVGISFIGNIKSLLFHPFKEVIKYKALWLFLLVLALGFWRDRESVKGWIKENAILMLSLAWSIIAFSLVFRPAKRALFFTETLSIILLLRFCIDNKGLILKYVHNQTAAKRVVFVVLGTLFVLDAVFAVKETVRQRAVNEKQLERLKESNGVAALDRTSSSHRMAYASDFPEWTWKPLAEELGVDSVHVFPYFCQDKYYSTSSPFKDLYIEEEGDYGKDVRLIPRIPVVDDETTPGQVVYTIRYDRPRKWYKQWLDKWRDYQYERTAVVEIGKPEVCFDGYAYYVIWFRGENVQGMKSIEMEK